MASQRDTLLDQQLCTFSEPFYSTRTPFAMGDDVRVQKIEQGQGVQVLTNNDVVYTFTGIQSPDRAWAVLVGLHNDALDETTNETTYVIVLPYTQRGYKRRNSVPLLATNSDLDEYPHG
jgi:hypothetical protein